jgi:hypothetical protein
VGAREVDHALDLAVAQAAPAQRVGGFEQVLQRGAEAAPGMPEDMDQVPIGQRLDEARAASRQRKGQRAHLAVRRAARQKAWVVDGIGHLAAPQSFEFGRCPAPRHAIGHTLT